MLRISRVGTHTVFIKNLGPVLYPTKGPHLSKMIVHKLRCHATLFQALFDTGNNLISLSQKKLEQIYSLAKKIFYMLTWKPARFLSSVFISAATDVVKTLTIFHH
jgi:hypothetical protein